MVKCDLNLSEIRGKVKTTIVKYKLKKQSLDDLKLNITKVLKEIPNEIAITYTTAVTDEIYNALPLGIVDLSPEFFNIQNITELLTGTKSTPTNQFEASTDLIVDEEQIKLRKNATSEFLDEAYGMVTEARIQAQNIANQHLFDALFINRGSIKGLKKGIVENDAELNNNIRVYQLQLLDKIVEYLNHIVTPSISEEVRQALSNPSIKVLPTLMPLINEYLSPNIFKSNPTDRTLDGLRSLYDRANNNSNVDKDEAKLKLDAYNAAVILRNFDSYLNAVLPDIIDIKDFGVKTGEDKYAISSKTAKLLTTWTNNDERNVEEEADFITKFAIKTSPMYYWQGNSPIDGLFLTFADYQYMIGKIKNLLFNENTANIVFGKLDENGNLIYNSINEGFWDSLTEETQNIIKGKKFSTLINLIRRNPRKYLPCVFEILSNERFYDLNNHTIFNKSIFSDDDLNKLYSLYKGIFSRNDSLYALSNPYTFDSSRNVDYFSYVTLIGDTITNVVPIQYYRNSDGILQCRTLISLNVNNIRRITETTINAGNSTKTIKDFEQYFKELNVTNVTDNSLTYTIPGTTLSATVYTSGNVVFYDNGQSVSNYKKYFDSVPVQLFLDSKLKLGIYLNPNLQNALRQTDVSYSNLALLLLSFASNIILKQYHAHYNIDDINDVDKKDLKLAQIFGKNAPKYNKQLEIVESVSSYDVPILRQIAIAKASVSGVFTATQVKDGEGNSQNLQTQSRLLGSHLSQFEMQESQPWSATKDCLIINTPGLYEGVFIAKEYYNDFEGSKSFVDMSVSEYAYSNFIVDYIGGLVTREENDNSIVGDGHVMFLPSVNSDKNTVDKIKVNLNKEVPAPDGTLKPLAKFNDSEWIINFSDNELRWLISRLFGNIYTNMYKVILQDLNIIHNYLALTWDDVPMLDYFSNFADFNKWWYEKSLLYDVGESPSDFIKRATLQYNKSIHEETIIEENPDGSIKKTTLQKSNRLHPLTFIDLTHFIVKDLVINGNDGKFVTIKKAITANLVLISQIARFNPNFLLSKHLPLEYIDKYPNEETFWKLKHKEILKSLLKSKFRVNTTSSKLKEIQYLREKYPLWVNSSGDIVLAIINGKRISSSRDLVRFKKDGLTDSLFIDSLDSIELHPAIKTWNYLDYLFTQEFMDCTVGSFINHPEKSKLKKALTLEEAQNNVLVLEAAQYQALNKRNVSFTAAMHEFQLNLLNGIPEEYNIAVIDDIRDEQGTITGLINGIKPFDGATIVNPFVVILENNSLCGEKAGITKKLFVHFKNERTGTGGIIKTCGFGLTNDWVRNSPFLLRMMRKMTDHVWLNEDGTPAIVDITKDYKGNDIILDNTYFKLNNRFFEIVNIKSLGNNQYQRVLKELLVDENGNPIKDGYVTNEPIVEAPVTINTNYLLWKYLGGMHSMSVDGNTLKYSNSSVENVVNIMNRTAGLDANGNIITRNGTNNIKTLDDLWQPLKHSDIHYVVTAGAIKQGAANINSSDRYFDDIDYDFLKIKMYQSGILLDKEHHADNSDLSLLTLVISACASLGYTFEAATRIYDALRKSTEIGIKDHLEAVKKYITSKDPTAVLEVLYEAIIHSLGNSKGNNFAYIIASDLIKQAKEGKKIQFSEVALPLSDKTVYSKIFSSIASYLTNSGIKQKIPGILSVLTPSYNIFLLYAGRKYESFNNPVEELTELQKEVIPVYDASRKWSPDSTRFGNSNIIYVNPGELINLDTGAVVGMKNRHDGNYYVDLAKMKEIFDSKAWRNPRRSAPLNRDFSTFEELMTFSLMHEAMHDIYRRNEGEESYDYETRINNEALKRIDSNISSLELGRSYHVTRVVNQLSNLYDEIAKTLGYFIAELASLEPIQIIPNSFFPNVIEADKKHPEAKSIIHHTPFYSTILILNDFEKFRDINIDKIPISKELSNDFKNLQLVLKNSIYSPAYVINISLEKAKEVAKEYHSMRSLHTKLVLRAYKELYNLNAPVTNATLDAKGLTPYITLNNSYQLNTKVELIRTPIEYLKLKKDIEQGLVTYVAEAYIDDNGNPLGCDLAAYNVRFKTADGKYFQLWDLDSATALFELNENKGNKEKYLEIANRLFPNLNIPLNKLEIYIRRMLLKDLRNLSKNTKDVMKLYDLLLRSLETWQSELTDDINTLDIDAVYDIDSRISDPIIKQRLLSLSPNILRLILSFSLGDTNLEKYDKIMSEYIKNYNNLTKEEVSFLNTISKDLHPSSLSDLTAIELAYYLRFGKPFKQEHDKLVAEKVKPIKDALFKKGKELETIVKEHPERRDEIINQYKLLVSVAEIEANDIGYDIQELLALLAGVRRTILIDLDYFEIEGISNIPEKSVNQSETWYDKYARWVNIYLGTGNGNKLHIPGFDGIVTEANFGIVEPLVRKLLENTTKVRINNQLRTVDKSSIKIQAYEIILPKTFATNFGLKEFDDLLTIKNNPDWFVELYRKNSQIKVNENNYAVALKTSTGNHTYLLTKAQLNNITLDLHKIDDIGRVNIDNKIHRVDNKGNILYEITDDFELYVDNQGNEVIVTNNLDFYINNGSFESIELSRQLFERPSIANNVLNNIKKSKNKVARNFYRYITSTGKQNIRAVYNLNVEYNKIPDKTQEDYERYSIIRALREKHTSFLKSLEVVAARIPSQSMQSFMPMLIVAFDNPDLNTAYVSTLQILLLGSDYC